MEANTARRVLRGIAFAGIPFGAAMAIPVFFFSGGMPALVGGVIAGGLFGVGITLFAEYQRRRMECRGGVFEGEAIVFQGPANHFRNREGRGGWLVLTKRRLAFRSHGSNFQNEPVDLAIEDVSGVSPERTLGLVPNGLRVDLHDGKREKFVVTDRRRWIDDLSGLVGGEKGGEKGGEESGNREPVPTDP